MDNAKDVSEISHEEMTLLECLEQAYLCTLKIVPEIYFPKKIINISFKEFMMKYQLMNKNPYDYDEEVLKRIIILELGLAEDIVEKYI